MKPKRPVPAGGTWGPTSLGERFGGSETYREDSDLSTDLAEQSYEELIGVYLMPKSKMLKGECEDAIGAESTQSKKALEGSGVHRDKGSSLRTAVPHGTEMAEGQ